MAVLFLLSFMVLLFENRLVLAAVISPSSGSFCNDGTSREFNCEVNGTTLVWLSGSNSAAFGSASMTSTPLGSYINTHFISAANDMVAANATVTGSPGLNGTTLECRNSLGVDTTDRAFITFVVASSGATSIEFEYLRNNMTNIAWGGATCVQFYNISVDGSVVATTSSLSYNYTFLGVGIYNFEIISIGYTGNIIGVISDTFNWQPYASNFIYFFENKTRLTFTIQGHDINQPLINYCTITIDSVTKTCTSDSVSFDVMLSSNTNITYNLTIVNDAGVSNYINTLSGDLVRLMNVTRTIYNTRFVPVTIPPSMSMGPEGSSSPITPIIGDPVVFVLPFIVLGVLIVLSVCWFVLRICWKRQCCCPRIWRSGFWLIFFCYDCCTYDAEEKEENTIGLKNPSVGEEKGHTSL